MKLPLPAAVVLLATAALAPAAPKIDLDRVTPVPTDQPIPTQDFFRPKVLRAPVLNPAGTHVAAIITSREDRHQLLVLDLNTKKSESVGGPGITDVIGVTWLDSRRLVFNLSSQKLYHVGLFAAEVGALKKAYPLIQYLGPRLISVPRDNPLQPLVWTRYDALKTERDLGVVTVDTNIRKGQYVDLIQAGADSAELNEVDKVNSAHITEQWPVPNQGIVTWYLPDTTGRLAFAGISQEGHRTVWYLQNGKWQKSPAEQREIRVRGHGSRPGELAILGPEAPDRPQPLQLLDVASGQLGAVLIQDDAYDCFATLYRDPLTDEIIGADYERDGPKMTWFNERFHKLQQQLEAAYPGLVVRLTGISDSQTSLLVTTYSDRHPASYHWIDLSAGSSTLIKNSAPWIDPRRMQPMHILQFPTEDGRKLDAYLTLPAGASKDNPPPLVVLPHGGPWVRDSWGFDPEVQFLAHHGYAVLQPNYRGSTGTEWRFPRTDTWDFEKMHRDVTAASRRLAASKLIDPDRIAIMGGSFGGYLALSGVVNEPQLYRCAVSIAGVFDWELQVKSEHSDRYTSSAYEFFISRLGDPKQEAAKYDAISPLRRVANIRVPVFVAGGKDDQVVEIQQSKKLLNALEQHKVPYEKHLVGGEGHGMAFLKHQVELYDRILAFLDKNLKPKK